MNQANTVDQRERVNAEEPRCDSCGGVVLVVATDYVTSKRCLSCGESQVIGWVSCQVGTLGATAVVSTWGHAR